MTDDGVQEEHLGICDTDLFSNRFRRIHFDPTLTLLQEHIDYDLVESTNPAFNKAIVRVNIFRQHRQTIQYVQPQHSDKLAQAELLVIDEAAAIPLPVVKKLLGPYLVFLCSTVNGYEGTGRSLSLKLIGQLREQQAARGEAGPGAKTEGSGEKKMGSSLLALHLPASGLLYCPLDTVCNLTDRLYSTWSCRKAEV